MRLENIIYSQFFDQCPAQNIFDAGFDDATCPFRLTSFEKPTLPTLLTSPGFYNILFFGLFNIAVIALGCKYAYQAFKTTPSSFEKPNWPPNALNSQWKAPQTPEAIKSHEMELEQFRNDILEKLKKFSLNQTH